MLTKDSVRYIVCQSKISQGYHMEYVIHEAIPR
jgi:hypothetical protein